jgi:hypothetical protein
MKTPLPVQIERMDAATFFARFAELLKDNPPGTHDHPMIHRLQRVGFHVGQGFDLNGAPPAVKQAFERATADGKKLVVSLGKKAAGEGGKGWVYNTTGGSFGVNYRERAAVAYYALGMNLQQDAVYPSLSTDSEGRPLDGRNKYVLHFEKGKFPPVDAFWSVTAYDTDGYFIPNALKRQALGDRDRLVTNADGSLVLYIQADSPGPDKEANWLPVAKAPSLGEGGLGGLGFVAAGVEAAPDLGDGEVGEQAHGDDQPGHRWGGQASAAAGVPPGALQDEGEPMRRDESI